MKGILLVNLGSPLSPTYEDVRAYLKEFLLDPLVVDYPSILRHLLVRGIIIPLRYRKVAHAYKTIWDKEGPPLIVYGKKVQKALQKVLGDEFHVALSMRYQKPSIRDGILELQKAKVSSITVIPLFPQYAEATTGSIIKEVQSHVNGNISVHTVIEFGSHPLFIDAWKKQGELYPLSSYDHILFSFHGLPIRQLKKLGHSQIPYNSSCIQTAQLIAESLKLHPSQYSISFQSRLGKEKWLQPYTNEVIASLAKEGKKKILVISASFVADCLETVYEIGVEGKRDFERHGGKTVDLCESLNESQHFISLLKALSLDKTCLKKL